MKAKDVARPSFKARKHLMARAKGRVKNKDSVFYISSLTGEIISSRRPTQRGEFMVNEPINSYEIHVPNEPHLSYKQLDKRVKDSIGMYEWEY